MLAQHGGDFLQQSPAIARLPPAPVQESLVGAAHGLLDIGGVRLGDLSQACPGCGIYGLGVTALGLAPGPVIVQGTMFRQGRSYLRRGRRGSFDFSHSIQPLTTVTSTSTVAPD